MAYVKILCPGITGKEIIDLFIINMNLAIAFVVIIYIDNYR